MISCKKGICEVDGTLNEIDTDLTVLIHAIDISYSDSFGKDEAYKHIKRCFDLAMETRNIKPDKVVDKGEVIDERMVQKLKNLDNLINHIIKEVENNGSAE